MESIPMESKSYTSTMTEVNGAGESRRIHTIDWTKINKSVRCNIENDDIDKSSYFGSPHIQHTNIGYSIRLISIKMVVVTSFCHPNGQILHEQKNTKVLLDKRDLGIGTLFISERTLSWKEEGNNGFSIQYPHITLHAISSDTNVYPQQCVYVMIDTHISLPGGEAQPQQDGSDSESEADISELIIAPEDSSSIQCVYDALKSGQTLNPDLEENDDDLDVDIFEDADEGENDRLPAGDFVGGGGDADMENLSNQLRHNYVTVYARSNNANGQQSTNGDTIGEDELFEDAD